MNLTSALQIAQSSLFNVSQKTSIVSRNITDADNEDYTRRQGVHDTAAAGSRLTVQRASVDTQLSEANLLALSEAEAQSLISTRFDRLNIDLNGPNGELSLSQLMTSLHQDMQLYSADPSNTMLAQSAVVNAKSIVSSLHNQSQTLNEYRHAIDADISREVDALNKLVQEFHEVNTDVVYGTETGRDVLDARDRRDALLKDISKIVPINQVRRGSDDLILVTKDGATLYESVPRVVSFVPTAIYNSGTAGNPIQIDGVPVKAGEGANTSAAGSLSALMQMRDGNVETMHTQLDEFARGLISVFAETDQTGGSPDLTGLFSWSGSPAVPPVGTRIVGLAGEISVSAAFDPDQGGSPSLLRDGGANGAAYVHNTEGGESYSNHLISLVQSMDVRSSFDNQTGISGLMSILTFANQTTGWIDGQRSDASQAALTKSALSIRLTEKISNKSGVNIDEEMTLLLQLEKSYEASARLIATVNEMFDTLLQSVR